MPMIVLRKFWSATRLLREKRWSDAVDLTRIRVADLYLARRPVPSEPARRARLLAATLNRRGGLSTVPVDAGDLAGTRDAVLKPYLRHRFAAAAAAMPPPRPG